MQQQAKRAEKWIAMALSLAVFSVGIVISYAAYHQRVTQHQQKLANEFEQTARQYAFLVQRQLDVYAATSQSLAAFVSASDRIDNEDFKSYVHAADFFGRLAGISSFGYLPRVPAGEVAAFERRAAREFPAFRVRERAPGAAAYYPLLYAVHAAGPQRTEQLRGIDFGSKPERSAAIRTATASSRTAATPALPALKDARNTPVVLTFTDARTREEQARGEAPGGMVYAAMNVRALFEGIDDGRILSLFDLEVYHERDGRRSPLFDADGVPHAGAGDLAGQYTYARQLRYADQDWVVHFFARPQYLAANADRHSAMVLAVGALLSLIAAYATFRLARHYVGRHTSAELANRFQHFFATHPFAVYSLDRDCRLVFANQKALRELGVDEARLVGTPGEQFVAPEHRSMAAACFREALAGQAVAYHATIVSAAGARSELAIVLFPILERGEVTRVLAFGENITERTRAERELHESRQKLQLVLDTVPLRVFWKDLDGVYQGANRRLLEEAGLESMEQIVGRTDEALSWGDTAAQFCAEDRRVMDSGVGSFNMQQARRLADGSTRWLEVSKVPMRSHDGAVVGLLGVARDITENKQMEAELVRRANHDSLTGLPNRAFFYAELCQAVERARRREGELALMYFDIDRFKQVNDTFGHDAGDEVIRTFAARVRAALRESDFMARLGGDEFVLIVEGADGHGGTAAVAEKLIAAMAPAFTIGAQAHPVTTSIGIALLERGMTADQLVKCADDAMYEAKRAGRNCFRHAMPASQG
jgi:diguanylate cyclase (GGDEF)-like protein/PAS domain S-box-containing protein